MKILILDYLQLLNPIKRTNRKDKINIITSKDKNYLLNNLDFIKKLKKYNI